MRFRRTYIHNVCVCVPSMFYGAMACWTKITLYQARRINVNALGFFFDSTFCVFATPTERADGSERANDVWQSLREMKNFCQVFMALFPLLFIVRNKFHNTCTLYMWLRVCERLSISYEQAMPTIYIFHEYRQNRSSGARDPKKRRDRERETRRTTFWTTQHK